MRRQTERKRLKELGVDNRPDHQAQVRVVLRALGDWAPVPEIAEKAGLSISATNNALGRLRQQGRAQSRITKNVWTWKIQVYE